MFNSHDRVYDKGMRFWYNLDPILEGYWGKSGVNTMVMQTVNLGIPGLQFEFPFTMRKTFCENDELVDMLAKCIFDYYEQTVCV